MENVVRTLVYDGQVSLTVADTTALVQEGIRLHRLSHVSAKTFGRALSAMTFMSACLKGEKGEISLSIRSDGLCEEIAVSGNFSLFLRGFIGNTNVVGEESACFGRDGSLTIIRDDGYARPFVGSCGLPLSGDIDEAFEEYYRISEQLPTRIATVVELDEEGACAFAGVVALQPLPFADEKTLDSVAAIDMNFLLTQVHKKGVVTAAKEQFETSEEVFELLTAQYKCNCSREYLREVLISLGERQMRQIIQEDGAVRVHCHYCNSDYEFVSEDADEMFQKK